MTISSVGTAANLHVIASLRDAIRPHELTRVDRLNSRCRESLVFEDGHLTEPNRSSLGLELDDDAFARACEA